MGTSVSVIVRIRNCTTIDVTSTLLFDIDAFDFGGRRPDAAFNGVSIMAGACLERVVDINSVASNCPFAVRLGFKDGSEDVFKVNAKSAYDSTEPNLRHLAKAHCVYVKQPGPRMLELVVQHTLQQKEELKARMLNKEAEELLENGRYEEASIKLLEAAQKANEDTKLAIKRNRRILEKAKGSQVNKKAEGIDEEGLVLLKENKYQQACAKFREALKVAKNSETIDMIEGHLKKALEAKDNQAAKMLKQEGLLLRKSGQVDRAVLKFDEALREARNSSLIASIKATKAETLCKEGLAELDNAWLVESSLCEASDQAVYKFAKAKFFFEQANSVKSDAEYKKLIEVVDIKIEGDKLYSIGRQLENEGSRFIDETVQSVSANDCESAWGKYEEAYKYYKKAKEKFEEGVRRGYENFKFNFEIVDEALVGIGKILNELEETKVEMKDN